MQKRNGNCIAPRDLGILCYVSTPAQVAPHGKDTRDKSYAPPYSISAAHPAHWAISVLSNFGSTILASSLILPELSLSSQRTIQSSSIPNSKRQRPLLNRILDMIRIKAFINSCLLPQKPTLTLSNSTSVAIFAMLQKLESSQTGWVFAAT